jgi:chromosome segregation ATPase
MSERDAYLQKLKGQLDEWNAEIDKLEARAAQATGDARLTLEEQMTSLRRQRGEAKARLAQLQGATDDAWEQLKTGLDEAWASLKEGVDRAKSALGA